MDEMKKVFRPEFMNRVDETIVFHSLTRDEILQIVDLMISRIRAQIVNQGMELEVTQDVKNLLAEEGFDPQFGARPLRRALQRIIEDPLAEELLLGRFTQGDTIRVELEDGRVFFTKAKTSSAAPSEPAKSGSKN